jgi:hypothetical protein
MGEARVLACATGRIYITTGLAEALTYPCTLNFMNRPKTSHFLYIIRYLNEITRLATLQAASWKACHRSGNMSNLHSFQSREDARMELGNAAG